MTIALASPRLATGAWSRHLMLLGVVAAGLLALFAGDVATLARLWWTSTTFGHCLFIGPVVAWLVWQRRVELARLTPVAWAPGLMLVVVGGLGWWTGQVAAVALARQLGLVLMLQGAVATLLGPRVFAGLLFPLGYAVFLVPFGEGLEPPLQQVTVALVMPMLHLAGLSASVDGVLIHAGGHWFEVAEACSGAKFVIAMLPFSVLVAQLCFRSWTRRAGFMTMALIVPVLANGVRAFATIYAAHLTSVERATGMDHIVYGWVFFAAVMAGVLAIGWRWFDRAPDDPAFDPATLRAPVTRTIDAGVAALLVLATASVFPAWAAAGARPAALPARIALPEIPGWTRVAIDDAAPWRPWHPGADHILLGRYADASGHAVDIGVALYAAQAEGRELVSFGTGVLREDDRWVRVADLPEIAGGTAVRITLPGVPPVERVVATWYRVGDAVTARPSVVKLQTLAARLIARPAPAMAIHLSAREPGGAAAIARFATALGGVETGSARIASGAR